ncbi:MAG: choice-of-anchor tandem repeat GloVer-containing protein, partial [Steroidobacteraceae bacterium]
MRPDRALGMLAATCAALALSGCGGGSSSGGAPRTYSVGGSISGLTQSGLVLTDNGADANTIAANATQFTMPTQVADGGNYVIAVGTQPAGETCTVIDGAGAVSGAVTSVAVDCAPWSIFTHSVLYSFAGGSDGVRPYAALIQASDGNFYGTTYGGGANSDGTVFKLTPSGSETVLYSFAGGSDGANPRAALIQASDGNFYG